MKNKILLTLFLIVTFLGLKSQTTIPALITTNQVWDISGSPYLLNQNSYIDSGVSVIVKPGVEIITTGQNKIDIDGEFQARGTWDSVIKITKVRMNFSQKSLDYNASTGRGAYFNYCEVEGNGSGSTALQFTSTSVKVDNSLFNNAHFSIAILSSYPYEASKIELTNSKFYGVTAFNSGSPIYCSSMTSILKVSGCLFSNASNIYTYGNVIFTNNTFSNLTNVKFGYMYGTNEISCNKFTNLSEGVTIDASNYNKKTNLTFNNNTLDNIGDPSTAIYNMLTLNRKSSSDTTKDSLVIYNNNFLAYSGRGAKVGISASNLTPTKTDTISFRSNYWGTSDSTLIESLIKDYSDDINIYGRINFSSFLTMPVIGCSYNSGCAIANFNYIITDSVVTFNDSSYSSHPYKVKWKFGDGDVNDSDQKTVIHKYAPGVFMVCMFTYDSLNNLCDSMCKIIHITSNTTCHASYYFAIDTTNSAIVYIVNTSTGTNLNTKYYWTFGDGTGTSVTNPTHTYTFYGKYQVCVTIFDTLANCYSTYCDSVDINSNGTLLRVLNANQVQHIENSGFLNSLAVFPNPSQGLLKISLGSSQYSDVVVEIINSNGQLIKSENHNAKIGINEININLSDYENGLYCINIRAGNSSKTVKLILNK